MYCPTCRAAYREGFSICADCGTVLVDSLPDEPKPQFISLVTVGRYRDLPEALVAQAALWGAGVSCHLANYHLISINWLYSNAVGGMLLQVHAEDADDARLVLAVVKAPLPPESEPMSDWLVTEATCAACGSSEIESVDALRVTGALALLLPRVFLLAPTRPMEIALGYLLFLLTVFVPAEIQRRRWRCARCKHTWRSGPSIDIEPSPGPSPVIKQWMPWLLWLGFALAALAMLRAYGRQG